ncbi:MAG: response regulator [Rhodocyclaceae bacterium]|nr:response regulator [Rhodocyclaceae bacterium]
MSDAPTILVVEDNETDRLIVRLFLEQAGHRVLEADSAESGLELCSRTRPDLLLIDGMLPFMDGFQMTRALRAIPEYRDTPILVLSGLEEPEWPARAIEAGATGFILKSNNWNELVERIGRYLP